MKKPVATGVEGKPAKDIVFYLRVVNGKPVKITKDEFERDE